VTISGYIKDQSNGELLIGATVYIAELKIGTSANTYGFYSLSVPTGTYTLMYSYIGYVTVKKTMKIAENTTLEIELEEDSKQLQEVVVSTERADKNVSSNEMSTMKLESKMLKQLPVMMGESDVLKIVQVMPGVQASSEASTGYSVRGGSSDQNLIVLDEATVYNASHVMGLFSVFNSDAIKDVKLYKGDIPASSGGRLSSLLDVRQKDGNKKQYSAIGGIGLIKPIDDRGANREK